MKPRISGPYPVLNVRGKIPQRYFDENNSHVDYNQNDPTQPDYMKNRPFYAQQQIVAQANLSELTLEETGEYFIPNTDISFLQDGDVLHIEVNDNGTVYKTEGTIEFYNDIPAFVDVHISVRDYTWLVGFDDDKRVFVVADVVDGVSLKIYKESVKKLDEKFLPECTVPYIYNEYGVQIETLPSGAYVLHGWLITHLGTLIHNFDSPTLCQIYKHTDYMSQLVWTSVSGLEDYSVNLMTIMNGEIADTQKVNLYGGIPEVTNVMGTYDYTAYNDMIPTVGTIKDYIAYLPQPQITLASEDGKYYVITVGTDGNLKATPM